MGKVIAVLFSSVRYTLSVLCFGRPQLDGFVIGDGDEEGRVGGGEGDAVDTLVVLQGGHLASPVPVPHPCYMILATTAHKKRACVQVDVEGSC